MVAYFKRQTDLFMAAGAALGLLAALTLLGRTISAQPGAIKAMYYALPVIAGVVLGRIAAAWWANRRLAKLDSLLYRQGDAQSFLQSFAPVAAKAPPETAEYINGQVKLAFAQEALGQFEEARARLAPLRPGELRLHALNCTAAVQNQELRLALLAGDEPAAQAALTQLEQLHTTALQRAPGVARQLQECLRLGRAWLAVLQKQPTDEAYLREEVELAGNPIHKAEMQLVLAAALAARGEQAQATELLQSAATAVPQLWAGRQAAQLLAAGA